MGINNLRSVPDVIAYGNISSGERYMVKITPDLRDTMAGERLHANVNLERVVGSKMKKKFNFMGLKFEEVEVPVVEEVFSEDFLITKKCSYGLFLKHVSKYGIDRNIANDMFKENWDSLLNYRKKHFKSEIKKSLL